MTGIGVLLKHSGRWNDKNVYEDYTMDAVVLDPYVSFGQLYEIVSEQIRIRTNNKGIRIEYKVAADQKPIQIHNDMGVKVYVMQKKDMKDLTTLPLYISLVEAGDELVGSSSLSCNGQSSGGFYITESNTREGADMVEYECDQQMIVCGDNSQVGIITDPAHKEIAEEQTYVTKQVLKAVVEGYAIRERFDYKTTRSSQSCYTVQCVSSDCTFVIRASQINKSGMFSIRKFLPEHTCPLIKRIYNHKHATSRLVSGIVKPKFKNHKRKYNPMEIKEDIMEALGLDVSYMVCWRARERALESLRGKPSASYAKLPAYVHMLKTAYPGSHVKLEKTPQNEFLYMYVSLYSFIRGFDHCRPVVVVDGSHMKSAFSGTFVCASTVDGAGHIFPLAYGVVDSENDASWTWFFENFKEAYGERNGMCVVSDRNESIIKAVSRVFRGVPHYACMWHLWNNVKKNFRKSHDQLTDVFYTMAKAYTKTEFNQLMEKIESVDSRVKEYLENAGYDKWARCYTTVHRGWNMTSNIAESINSTLVSARELPIYNFLEQVRLVFANWNFENRQEASFTFTTLIGKSHKLSTKNEAKSTRMTVLQCNEFMFTVHDKDRHFIVCLRNKTCTCEQFQMDEIPCSHAWAVLKKMNFDLKDYSSDLFKPKTVMRTYEIPILPLPNDDEWLIPKDIQMEMMLPPKFKRSAGRPKKNDRWKNHGEKAGKKGKNKCSKCGFKGHNRRSCKNEPRADY